ncbi:MAG: FAD-dependent oxidoreductase [Halobacteriales archaeon]
MTGHGVAIVGGGVAGLTAGIFTARHGFGTRVVSAGGSLLRRNAHLENVPGFPAGVNARLFLDMLREQADHAGCDRHEGEVTRVEPADGGFAIETAAGEAYRAGRVVVATKNGTDPVAHFEEVGVIQQGGKRFLDVDERGRTGLDGLYAAGRVALKPHQTVIAAGHGAEVAVTLIEDSEEPFYHDWVAPEGYFTGRGRDLPPGCEEIGTEEFRRRERESLEAMRAHFADPHPEEPEQHPSVAEDE